MLLFILKSSWHEIWSKTYKIKMLMNGMKLPGPHSQSCHCWPSAMAGIIHLDKPRVYTIEYTIEDVLSQCCMLKCKDCLEFV